MLFWCTAGGWSTAAHFALTASCWVSTASTEPGVSHVPGAMQECKEWLLLGMLVSGCLVGDAPWWVVSSAQSTVVAVQRRAVQRQWMTRWRLQSCV
eukprot:5470681-Karenia_brevis.AAC.1